MKLRCSQIKAIQWASQVAEVSPMVRTLQSQPNLYWVPVQSSSHSVCSNVGKTSISRYRLSETIFYFLGRSRADGRVQLVERWTQRWGKSVHYLALCKENQLTLDILHFPVGSDYKWRHISVRRTSNCTSYSAPHYCSPCLSATNMPRRLLPRVNLLQLHVH